MNLTRYDVPPLSNWQDFEEFCQALLVEQHKSAWTVEPVVYGRPGQAQGGLDLSGERDGTRWGYQCKRTEKLTWATIEEELSKLDDSKFSIDRYVVLTTAKRDVAITRKAAEETSARRGVGKCSVQVLFWRDLMNAVSRHPSVAVQHLPEFKDKLAGAFLDDLTRVVTARGGEVTVGQDGARAMMPASLGFLIPSSQLEARLLTAANGDGQVLLAPHEYTFDGRDEVEALGVPLGDLVLEGVSFRRWTGKVVFRKADAEALSHDPAVLARRVRREPGYPATLEVRPIDGGRELVIRLQDLPFAKIIRQGPDGDSIVPLWLPLAGHSAGDVLAAAQLQTRLASELTEMHFFSDPGVGERPKVACLVKEREVFAPELIRGIEALARLEELTGRTVPVPDKLRLEDAETLVELLETSRRTLPFGLDVVPGSEAAAWLRTYDPSQLMVIPAGGLHGGWAHPVLDPMPDTMLLSASWRLEEKEGVLHLRMGVDGPCVEVLREVYDQMVEQLLADGSDG